MFTDAERNELVGRLLLILEQEKVGRADARQSLAEQLADTTRNYLGGRYNTKRDEHGGFGVHKGQDLIRPDDFPQR